MPDTSIRTVIIPAAGKGTRLLPATKVTAKELLPVYDRVLLDFAIDEAVGIGAERIVIVISTAKISIQDYLGGDGLRVCGNDNAPSDESLVRKSSMSFKTGLLAWVTRCFAAETSRFRVRSQSFCLMTS